MCRIKSDFIDTVIITGILLTMIGIPLIAIKLIEKTLH